ncbi:Protein of unknown function [Bacillus wiedmannii]|nr:Protein of unknown function [Bacillus wiedmannii]
MEKHPFTVSHQT